MSRSAHGGDNLEPYQVEAVPTKMKKDKSEAETATAASGLNGFRLLSRSLSKGYQSTTFASNKGCNITIVELVLGFVVGGHIEELNTTEHTSNNALFLYSLSDESIQLQLNEDNFMKMMKGRESITLNVHGTVMVTSRVTLELLASECLARHQINDPFCLRSILFHLLENEGTAADKKGSSCCAQDLDSNDLTLCSICGDFV